MGKPEGNSPYTKITLVAIPENDSNTDQVLADVEKLDLSGNLLDSEYPPGDINYNDGLEKKSNPFHKISKFYGRNKNVFLFLETLRDEKSRALIMNQIEDKSGKDSKVAAEFRKNMKTFLNRIYRGEKEAESFLQDSDMKAFFNGFHVNHPGHTRNIHENLNVNVTRAGKVLKVSDFFSRTTPLMTAEESFLKRVKVFANGQRAITVVKEKENDAVTNYSFNKHAEMDLEIGWPARNEKGVELFCEITLKVKEGKLALKKVAVEGEQDMPVIAIAELAKQNDRILIKNKKLHEVLANLEMWRTKEVALEVACLVQANLQQTETAKGKQLGGECREVLTVEQVPSKSSLAEQEIFADFQKLEFSPGPFSASDEINFNDGLEANPFDKIAKVYGRHKDVFLFKAVLMNAEKRANVLEIVEEKCKGLSNGTALVQKFKKRMETYLERISGGAADSRLIVGEGIDGFFHGCYFANNGQRRNPHQNLNVNACAPGESFDMSTLFDKRTQRMEVEDGKLERIKLYGNGKRIMNVIKQEGGRRNYVFSKLANINLAVEWIGHDANNGQDVPCRLVLQMNNGQLAVKQSCVNGQNVGLAEMIEYAKQNKKILIRGNALFKVVAEQAGSNEGLQKSQEIITIEQLKGCPVIDLNGVLEDFEKLDFSSGPHDPNDKLNYNEGLVAHPFQKLRKFYGRNKNIFVFLAALEDPVKREEIRDIIKRKCEEDSEAIQEFDQKMKQFLERAELGRKHAKMFLGNNDDLRVDALFAGYHVPGENGRRRNIHANLNIDLGKTGNQKFNLSSYFERETPNWDEENGELQAVKIFGNGKRIFKIAKTDGGQRNYMYSNGADMLLNIKWETGDKMHDVVLKFREGQVVMAEPPSIELLEFAKKNDALLLRGKRLHVVLQEFLDKSNQEPKDKHGNFSDGGGGDLGTTELDGYIVVEDNGDGTGLQCTASKIQTLAAEYTEDSDSGDDGNWIDNAALE